jgi:pilus assembly protein CpaF
MLKGFERILPHLQPIEHLIFDPDISEIMLNPDGTVWCERAGQLTKLTGITLQDTWVRHAVENCARSLGTDVNQDSPILNASLPDGSRLTAVLSPIVRGQTTFCIRKFNNRKYDLPELIENGTLDPEALKLIRIAIEDDRHILISGGTSTGKTTLLNALTSLISKDERIILIEDTAELELHQNSPVQLLTRTDPERPVTAQQLLRGTMRMRPDRVIVGEVRGAEAADLLDCLNSGHGGSFATIHANDPKLALDKLRSYVQKSSSAPPVPVIDQTIALVFHLVVQLKRAKDGRRFVSEIIRLCGYDRKREEVKAKSIWVNHEQGCISCLRAPKLRAGRQGSQRPAAQDRHRADRSGRDNTRSPRAADAIFAGRAIGIDRRPRPWGMAGIQRPPTSKGPRREDSGGIVPIGTVTGTGD